ncbi:MAG TPA: PhoU domain-containing protein [Accumulibacter sp.]|nr:PhoU domain-containing protein [Accumulibacter sp.]
MELSGKSVLMLGLGESGLAMAKWLSRQGARLRVADSRQPPPHLSQLQRLAPQATVHPGPFAESLADGVDLIAISPGVPLDEPLVRSALARQVRAGDQGINRRYRALLLSMIGAAMENPSQLPQMMELMSIAQALERVADYAKNIADEVVYLVDAVDLRHQG